MSRLPRDLRVGDAIVHVSARRTADGGYELGLGERRLVVAAGDSGAQGFWFEDAEGRRHHAFAAPQGEDLAVRVDGRTWLLESAVHEHGADHDLEDPTRVEAPMTGTIVKVLVAEGAEVEDGADLVVLTAMKMEHRLRAACAGRVTAVACAEGETVEAGAVLVRLEPA
ncbi:MAG: biotin/lipoyl-containing protein [Planctomycetota bacterium]